MKLGLVISLIIVLFLGLLGFFAYRGVADPPTDATSSSKLAKMQLPTDLPPLFMPTIPNGDAARTYNKVLELYHDHRETLTGDVPPTQLIDQLVRLLIEAVQQERVPQGFLDKYIDVRPGATPGFHDALEAIPGLALMRADELYNEGNQPQAVLATRAVWALGQRAYAQNIRLYNRLQGLTIMLDAGDKLLPWTMEMTGKDAPHIRDWMKVVHEIDQVWQAKYELLSSLRPHVGDLLHIARDDKDPSFRVAAILKLGLAKFNPGGRGNRRLIYATIEDAKNHSDSLVAQAGIAAAGMTRQEMRKLY